MPNKNLKHCPGCHRDLPRSMYPKHGKGRCFHCVFNGPGVDKEDVMNIEERNTPDMEELVYVKHDEKIINTIKNNPEGLSRKEISRKTGMTADALYPHLVRLEAQGQCRMVKEVVDNRLTNIYYPPGAVEAEPNNAEEVPCTPCEVQDSPKDDALYTARELADTYLEGFKDGVLHASVEQFNLNTDKREGYG